METQDAYREFAQRCEQMAEDATFARHKQMLQEMAKEWRRLAEEAGTLAKDAGATGES